MSPLLFLAERVVREAWQTLDNLILVGEGQLYRAMKKIEKHHNEQRPHQGLGGRIPSDFDWPETETSPDDIECDESLGGLLRHYHVRRAA